jgi:hypothetical protein
MKTRYLLGLLLIAAMVFPTMVGAAGTRCPALAGGPASKFQGGSATAAVVSTACDAGGPNTYTASANVAAGSSVTFLPDAFAGMPQGFRLGDRERGPADQGHRQPHQPPGRPLAFSAAWRARSTRAPTAAADTSVFPIVKNASVARQYQDHHVLRQNAGAWLVVSRSFMSARAATTRRPLRRLTRATWSS